MRFLSGSHTTLTVVSSGWAWREGGLTLTLTQHWPGRPSEVSGLRGSNGLTGLCSWLNAKW